MCALLLKHNPPPTRGFFAWFNRQVDRVTRGFGHAVEFVIKRMVVAFVLLGVFLYAIWHLFHTLPSSFVPQEDQGYAMVAIIMPQAASLERTQAVAERADAILAKIPGVQTRSLITGYSLVDAGFKTNSATIFITFKDFKERYADIETAKEQNARAILTAFYDQAKHIQEAVVIPIAPPAIPGIGTTGGFEFWIQDTAAGSPVELGNQVQAFLAKARQRPELAGVNTTFNANSQQLRADVDREKAMLLQVPVQDVYSAIQAQFGSLTASQFSQYSRVWWVIVQSDAQFRQTPGDLTRLYTRSNQGKMVPLSAVVSTEWTAGPDLLPHFNGFPAAKVIGNAAAGYSSGQAIATMEELARELPPSYTFAWSGLAFEEKQSGGTSSLAFVFGLLIVFLVLAAQYESWTLPGAVMTAIPFGVLGALAVNHIRGLENDVYFQIGLLVLIGLGAKNAVLRVSRGGGLPQAGLQHHGCHAPGRRAAPAPDHHDLAGLRGRRAAAGAGGGCGGQCAPLHRHRHHRRHDRRDHAGDAVRAAVLLHLRPLGRGPQGQGRSQGERPRPTCPPPARRPEVLRLTAHHLRRTGAGRLHAGPGLQAPARSPRRPPSSTSPRTPPPPPTRRGGTQFQDPVLEQLIDEALKHNTNVQIAAANVEQAAAFLTQTRSQLFPTVGYGAGAQRERTREPAFASLIPNYPNPASAYQAALQASWEIDLWGRIRRQSEAAYANVLATDEARRGVILTLVAQVANSYLQLRGLDAQLDVAKKTLQTYKESVDLFTLQFQYGQVSMMNVAQAQSQYETAAAQIPLIESQIAQTQSSLAVLIGRDPGPILRGKSVYDLQLPQVPAGVPSQLLERRPDLTQAEQQLIAANAQIGAAKALYFPTISLTGAYGNASADLSKLFSGPAKVWSYAGSLAGPIFTLRRGQRPGGAGRKPAERGAAELPAVDPQCLCRRGQRADRQPEAEGAAGRAGQAGGRAAAVQRAGAAAVRRRLHQLQHRAAGRAGAVPGRAEPGVDPRAGVRLGGEHLQGHGRRLGERRPTSAPAARRPRRRRARCRRRCSE